MKYQFVQICEIDDGGIFRHNTTAIWFKRFKGAVSLFEKKRKDQPSGLYEGELHAALQGFPHNLITLSNNLKIQNLLKNTKQYNLKYN